jgi:3-hydroxyacyl-CoA dehydrogenase
MLDAQRVSGTAVVIGAGTMGGGIAAQLANAGWQVRLLDVAGPDDRDPKTRNQAASAGLARVTASRPPLLYVPEFASRIHVGNTTDHLDRLQEADWVIEAVVENMEVKRSIMGLIEAHSGPETLVSSNTSGLSLREMTAERSPEFRARFLGTHFLNPPRYLKLLEVIPLRETASELTAGFQQFAEQVLGHRVIVARDTPGFISTRIWIAHLMDTIHAILNDGLTVEEADYLTGTLLGRPSSATLRMADIVGLDIIANIARNQYERLASDPLRDRLLLPEVMHRLIEGARIGQKVGTGFYARDGRTILALDLQTMEYRPRREIRIDEVERLARLPLVERLSILLTGGEERWQRFLARILNTLVDYVEQVGPEIAADALTIDRVMEWGFHWEIGPCALHDCRPALDPAQRYYAGTYSDRRYRVFGTADGQAAMQALPEEREWLRLADLKAAGKTIHSAAEGSLIDLGDGVVCAEYHTKMNTFDPGLVRFLDDARELAERSFAALVIGSQAANFSAGYNLKLFLETMATEDWSRLDALLHDVQHAFLRLKYARVPVVGAPYGYTLGAGCEGSLHCAALQAAPELYMGLPELNVGVIPAGGGTKELLARAMANWDGRSDAFPLVEPVFDRITGAQYSSSAEQARRMALLRATDRISRNADRQLYEAKQWALALASAGYEPPARKDVWILGEEGLARLRLKIHWQRRAGQISEHDHLIADRIAWVLSGGNLPYPQHVSEEYLLRLEREAFIRLAHEEKTAERMRHILATGKPLKN